MPIPFTAAEGTVMLPATRTTLVTTECDQGDAMRTVHRSAAILLPAALMLARQAGAQSPTFTIHGRVQAQFSAASGDSTDRFRPDSVSTSGFEIRRLRIQAEARIGDNITMVLAPSFEMSTLRLRDAYLRVQLWHSPKAGLGLTIGQEKKPFNRYELMSSNNLLSIERGIRAQGLKGPEAQNNLLEDNLYIAHDIGASVDLSGAHNRLALKAGVYNGSGESARDVNTAKSFGLRATATVLQDSARHPLLRVGAAFFSRDRGVTSSPTANTFSPDSSHRSNAFGLDAEWGDFRPGLHVIADFAAGQTLRYGNFCSAGAAAIPCRVDGSPRNFGNLRPNAPDSAFSDFATVQVIAGWRWQLADPAGTRMIKTVEPALRVDRTDPSTGDANDEVLLLTPTLAVYFSATTILRAGVDVYRYHDAAGASQTVSVFRMSWQANF